MAQKKISIFFLSFLFWGQLYASDATRCMVFHSSRIPASVQDDWARAWNARIGLSCDWQAEEQEEILGSKLLKRSDAIGVWLDRDEHEIVLKGFMGQPPLQWGAVRRVSMASWEGINWGNLISELLSQFGVVGAVDQGQIVLWGLSKPQSIAIVTREVGRFHPFIPGILDWKDTTLLEGIFAPGGANDWIDLSPQFQDRLLWIKKSAR